ncbi:hypothetical protein BKA69DRAFT_1055607 [Paraphysoderma sedebokerense]|nr:hypothetical protein BKA69DRAFT_1055607 [Paraphysoderma sedebokerense]
MPSEKIKSARPSISKSSGSTFKSSTSFSKSSASISKSSASISKSSAATPRLSVSFAKRATDDLTVPSISPNVSTRNEKKLLQLSAEDQALAEKVGIAAEELVEFREIFSLVDKDGGGTISKDELALLMQTLGLRAGKVELEIMVNEIVSNADEIDFESFVVAMSRKVTSSLPKADLLQAFKKFDEGDDDHPTGKISTEILFKVLTEYGDPDKRMDKEEVEDLINQVCSQALEEGVFDYKNYISILFSS